MDNEKAHYSIQCWDLETFVSDSWLECVGCADRGCYDLSAHSKSGVEQLTSERVLEEPIIETKINVKLDMRKIGQDFQKYASCISKTVSQFKNNELEEFYNKMDDSNITVDVELKGYNPEVETSQLLRRKQNADERNNVDVKVELNLNESKLVQIKKEHIKIEKENVKILAVKFIPHVIEPSFGIDRLLYSVFEQNFWAREDDDKRLVLSLPQCLVPYEIAVYKLYKDDNMNSIADQIVANLNKKGYRVYTDDTNTNIGKRYVRSDEIGIKYVITVDTESHKDNKVTIRERDTMKQNRVEIVKLDEILNKL